MTEVEEFTAALHRLWREAGRPAIAELARRINMNRNYLSQVFNGKLHSSWLTVELLVVAMGGNPAEFEPLYQAMPVQRADPPTDSEVASIAAFLTIAAAFGQAQREMSGPAQPGVPE